MERIVIVILLLLDVFLLSTVLSDRAESRRSDSETVERLTAFLAENGITAEEDAVSIRSAPPRMKLLRSSQREAEIARVLLGRTTPEDLSGNIFFYRTGGGQIIFRGSGEVAALFSGGEIPLRGSAERTARRLMRRAGAEAELRESGETETGEPYAELMFCQDGYPVYNASLQFDFSENGLYMITGTRLFDTPVPDTDSALMNSVSVLLRFAELTKSEGIICSRLLECRPGYLLSVVVSGENTLTPVWQIRTDAGTFLINAETGKLETGTT